MISLDGVQASHFYPLHFLEANASQQWILRTHTPSQVQGVRCEHGSKKPQTSVACRVVILSHKVTFPVSMNYSYILVRDMV